MSKNQDFSDKNIKGKSFKGQSLIGANFKAADIQGADFSGANLCGANFSNADIRSVNFARATLIGANFYQAKAGLQRRWVITLLIVALLLSSLSGLISTVTGAWSGYLLSSALGNQVAGLIIITSCFFFIYIILKEGLQAVPKALGIAGAILGILSIVGVIAGNFSLPVFAMGGWAGVVFGTGVGIITVALALAVSTSTVIFVVWVGAVAGGMALGLAVSMTIIASVIGSVIVEIVAGAGSFSIALVVGGVSAYIGWQALLTGEEKHTFLREMAITFATIGGTSFRLADLTDANFNEATLKSTDFSEATLTRTNWSKSKMLDRVRPGTTYLKNVRIHQVLITGQGQDKNFDRQDLRGVNLQRACLVNSSFTSANLSEASLQNAILADANFTNTNLSKANLHDTDLSRAKLVQTQLDGTDLTGATLTGATIEDWNITSHTILQGVRCDYVFMRLPTSDDPNPRRKPDNWNETFKDGDFADFIKPIVDTLDLYHNSNVDPRAIAISFKQLAENHPEAELRIVGMEVKGEDKFLLRAKTAPTADKSELSAEYFTIYNELKVLAQQEIKALMAEKDNRIASLENMVVTALQSPSFYAETYNNQGDTMPRKESNFNLQGAQFAGGLVNAETVNAHQIGGNITNYTSQQQNSEQTKTILILAANPKVTTSLRLDEEVREIDSGLRRAKKRELFDLKQRWAVRIQEVYQSLLDFKPQIVHFSGHGTGDDGLVLEDETGNVQLVDTVALAGLFELFANTIECVLLNACYSEIQASAISQHIPYVIGMKKEVGDLAAIKFATGFYNALGNGESVEFAYKLGCSVIQLDGIAEHLTPVLKKKQ